MAKFSEILSPYQKTRILNRIENGEGAGKVFADYIEFVGNLPLSLVFQQMREHYQEEEKSDCQFALDFLNNVDVAVGFGIEESRAN
jgi:hypothetical protein